MLMFDIQLPVFLECGRGFCHDIPDADVGVASISEADASCCQCWVVADVADATFLCCPGLSNWG